MLEVVNVSKNFTVGNGKNKSIINPLVNVSITIENGKKIGLIGASGEGKSTLANILCGICAPSDGKVYVDGVSLWSDKGKYDRKTGSAVQLIPQKPALALDPTQRIGSAIKEAFIAFKSAKRGKDAEQKMYELFDIVGLEHTLASRLPIHLSGGQAQRAVIARALALNPQVLVCDESTSMLDPTTQKNIIDLLDRLVKERGVSVLFISHDTRLVSRFCDDVYFIKEGNVEKISSGDEQL